MYISLGFGVDILLYFVGVLGTMCIAPMVMFKITAEQGATTTLGDARRTSIHRRCFWLFVLCVVSTAVGCAALVDFLKLALRLPPQLYSATAVLSFGFAAAFGWWFWFSTPFGREIRLRHMHWLQV